MIREHLSCWRDGVCIRDKNNCWWCGLRWRWLNCTEMAKDGQITTEQQKAITRLYQRLWRLHTHTTLAQEYFQDQADQAMDQVSADRCV